MKVSLRAPSATPSRVISTRPRVISAMRVLAPKPRPSEMPAPIASTFLVAPPDLHTDHVGRRVGAEVPPERRLREIRRERFIAGRNRHRGRQARADFPRERRPRKHRRRHALAEHPGSRPGAAEHPSRARSPSSPRRRARRREMRRDFLQQLAQCGWGPQRAHRASATAAADRPRRAARRGNQLREVTLVAAFARQLCDMRRIATPQQGGARSERAEWRAPYPRSRRPARRMSSATRARRTSARLSSPMPQALAAEPAGREPPRPA